MKVSTHFSVVVLTSSRFQRPQVNWRVVDTKSKILVMSRAPIGAKKYVKISLSPVIGGEEQKWNSWP